MRSLLLLAVLAAAGCAAPSELPEGGVSPEPVEFLAEYGEKGLQADVLCTFGGGHAVARVKGYVASNMSELVVEVFANGTFSGVQVGYSVDDAEPVWLDPVAPPGGQTTIPIERASGESGPQDERWRFFAQLNVPAATQDCYTGAGNGDYHIVIRGSMLKEAGSDRA